jgi:hypothetical protein
MMFSANVAITTSSDLCLDEVVAAWHSRRADATDVEVGGVVGYA